MLCWAAHERTLPRPIKASETNGSAEALPEITFRQLEVFSVTCKERSYANAALELHSTRANIKRVWQEFEAAVGRPLFEEKPDRRLVATPFAQACSARRDHCRGRCASLAKA